VRAVKRRKKSESGPPASVRVWVIQIPKDPEEVLERYKALALAEARRATPFQSEHAKRQHKKEHGYREIQTIAESLRANDPVLRRAKPNRLADTIREKLRNRGRTVSIKTIVRALQQTKK